MTVSRVYEFAKAHNMSSKAVLELAKKNGIEFNSHMSSMTEGQTQELERLLRQPKAAPAEKATQKPKQDKPAPKAKPEAKQGHKQPESKGQNQAHMAKSLLKNMKAKPRLSLKVTAIMANSLTTKINVITKQTLTLTAEVVVAAVRTVVVTTVKMLT